MTGGFGDAASTGVFGDDEMIVKNKSMDSLLEKFADEEIGKRESHGDMNVEEDDAPVFGGAFAGLGGIG